MVSRRRPDPLGLILGADDGLYQVVPGDEPERVIEAHRFIGVDYYDGLAIAIAAGVGAWVHAGRRWQLAWEGNPRSASITSAGSLFIGTVGGGLFRSDDQGTTWREIEGVRTLFNHNRFPAPAGERGPYVASVVEAGDGLLLGIAGGGGWHTRDEGTTWLRRSEGLDPKLHGLWTHPERTERLYATTDTGLFRSEDDGYSWLQSIGGLDRSWAGTLAVMPGAPDALILTVARSGPTSTRPHAQQGALFRSPNGGVTWARQMLDDEDEWDRVPVVVRPWDWEDVAFVAGGDGLWATHDRGRDWVSLGHGFPVANALAASL
jgi:photosystem II stability/assembly factor-like uncharacterized protein